MNVTVGESVNNRTLLALDKLQRLMSRWMTANEVDLINRCNAQNCKNTDASILYLLHTEYGFTAEQLTEFLSKHKAAYSHLSSYDFSLADISEVNKLKDIGVNLDELEGG